MRPGRRDVVWLQVVSLGFDPALVIRVEPWRLAPSSDTAQLLAIPCPLSRPPVSHILAHVRREAVLTDTAQDVT